MLQSLRWSSTHRAFQLAGGVWLRVGGRTDDARPIELGRIERVLVVRLDEMGDLVLTTPFLRELRRNLPDASIALLVRSELANLVERCPYVDEVLTTEPVAEGPWRWLQTPARAAGLARRELWPRNFDLAITPRWDVDSGYAAAIGLLSGARQRLGYSERVTERKTVFNSGLDRLLTHPVTDDGHAHEVEKNLALIVAMGGAVREDRLELWCGEPDERTAAALLREHRAAGGELVVAVSPGAGHPKRMWPLAKFARLGAWLQHRGARVVLVGGRGEEPLGLQLRHLLGDTVVNAIGCTSMRETGALLKRCHLFIGNDAGPMHLAAAAGLPVVEISCHPDGGSIDHVNSPMRFGPWGVPQAILRPATPLGTCSDACVAERAHCIDGVSVEQVTQAATALLSRLGEAAT
ncbi:MAG: glycosyltransferase family 9 protein [Acidimicrobiia bacterium]|nr:glycosyltransferase family 9 protein [Acidimicrobiia bacterium]